MADKDPVISAELSASLGILLNLVCFSVLAKDDIMKVAAKEHAKDLNSATICEKSICFVSTN